VPVSTATRRTQYHSFILNTVQDGPPSSDTSSCAAINAMRHGHGDEPARLAQCGLIRRRSIQCTLTRRGSVQLRLARCKSTHRGSTQL